MSGSIESVAFDTAERESKADALGMWVLVGSEAMLFGAVLLVFFLARGQYGEAFAAASKRLSLPLGTLNTAVLITSSFTMILAHHFCTAGRWRAAVWSLGATGSFGILFLVIKGTEYAKEFSEGIAPVLGAPFTYSGPDPIHAQFFFGLYFATTGLHALHLIGGIAAVSALLVLWPHTAATSRLRRVQAVGLYWHFVDIIWVFLFPILYLIDRTA
jgi:cytochrome c oxidase subunit 3